MGPDERGAFSARHRQPDAATAKVHGLTFITRNTKDMAATGVACVNPFAGA